jgi:DNA polymerase-3 subunit epsilon
VSNNAPPKADSAPPKADSGRFVAFDLETTGLVAGVDRIVEMGAVLFEGEQVLEEYQQLVDPGVPMPAAASRVNGITDDMLRGRPTVAEALPCFLALLRRGTPVAHNACFDVGFLSADIEISGCLPPPGPVLDTRGMAKRAFPGRFSYSLANLVRDHHLEVPGAHRALADAHACRLLFQLCTDVIGKADEKGDAAGNGPPTAGGRLAPGGPLAAGNRLDRELRGACAPPLDFSENAPHQVRTAAQLQRALREGTPVTIEYRSARGELTERTIQPLAFDTMGGALVIIAFCELRGSERTFRLDAILEVRPAQ